MPYQFGFRPNAVETRHEGATLGYRLSVELDQATAWAYVLANTPTRLGVFYRKDLRLSFIGGGIWDIDVEYATKDKREPKDGNFKWSFDSTGQTKKVTQAVAHIATYSIAGRTQIDHAGAIGVTDDAVEGVEIIDRAFKWAEVWQLAIGGYGFIYSAVLGELTGGVNASYFRGFPAYTVRFDGASGGQSSQDDLLAEFTFNFSVSPSQSGLSIGSGSNLISGIEKIGWDYLWTGYETVEDADAKKTTLKLVQADVDRVYYPFNFSIFGIGTGILP